MQGGLLYVSDILIQDGDRDRSRYDACARESAYPYGAFTTSDGAICRHHDIGHVHHPQLVGPVRVELAADQIVRWFRAVAAGAAMATPPIDALDVGLAHQPLDLLARAADLLIAQA